MNQSTTKVQNIERGTRISAERKRLKLSQPAFADAGGVGKGSQILYEKGNPPTADYLERIASIGADIFFILTGRRMEAPTASVSSVDQDRLERAIELIERGIIEGHRVPSPKAKAEMIIAAYELLNEPSEATTERILRLVVG